MCHLVEHHDHMDRYIEKRLADYISNLERFSATLDSKHFARRAAPAISAFSPTIICEDCNNADATAKKLVSTHPDFSFSASDIRKFILVRSNVRHNIDEQHLNDVWERRKTELQRRFDLGGVDKFIDG